MRKTIVLLVTFILAMLGILAAKSMVIFKTDGTKVVYHFDDFTEVTYPTGNTVRVHKTDLSTVDYNAAEIDSILFVPNPLATTLPASEITQLCAVLNGTVNPNNGGATTVAFEYGLTTEYGNTINATQSPLADGTNAIAVSADLSGLTHNTTYHYRVKASNAIETTFGEDQTFTATAFEMGTVTDIDGNVYQTIKIGNQWWMMENLKVTKYRNGDEIPNITDNGAWAALSTGGRCAYNNDENNAVTYGYFYNWYAATDARNIAPEGWHVPSKEEFQELLDAVGTDGYQRYDALIDGGSSGFGALGGGYRDGNGNFNDIGYFAYFWSSAPYSSSSAGLVLLGSGLRYAYLSYHDFTRGFSVRCVRD